ncbi:DUF4127 family protein [Bacillaceae bacterium SIJ1]|nr:DUF4127 family protein [Litoribacterium kuwaitense]NGP46366.1 DUF4127 family protein [Litoribacterium kuwaitense]
MKGYTPDFFLEYSSTLGPTIIPALEDRSLNESIKAQLTTAHAYMTTNEDSADIHLLVHAPGAGQERMSGPGVLHKRDRSYFSEVNIRSFIHSLERHLNKGRHVAIADVATLNGSDHQLMRLLSKKIYCLPSLLTPAGTRPEIR